MDTLKRPTYNNDRQCTHENNPTKSSLEQMETEDTIGYIMEQLESNHPNWRNEITLNRSKHVRFLYSVISKLPYYATSAEPAKPWICFWIFQALDLLEHRVADSMKVRLYTYLNEACQHPDGGYGGTFGYTPHLATSFAAMQGIAVCGMVEGDGMYRFLMRMKMDDGSFMMTEGGEADVRGCYCALVCASYLNLMTDELVEGVADFVASCQTYEGGIAGNPYSEAHGGYTFCGVAALAILDEMDKINLDKLLFWLSQKQMSYEGGFQGRTNKLVDSCYSFWQGSVFPILDQFLLNKDIYQSGKLDSPGAFDAFGAEGGYCFDQLELQRYILACCQDEAGGLKDKPGMSPDVTHTCYALSGLSLSQHNPVFHPDKITNTGSDENILAVTNPVYNVLPEKLFSIMQYFKDKYKSE